MGHKSHESGGIVNLLHSGMRARVDSYSRSQWISHLVTVSLKFPLFPVANGRNNLKVREPSTNVVPIQFHSRGA